MRDVFLIVSGLYSFMNNYGLCRIIAPIVNGYFSDTFFQKQIYPLANVPIAEAHYQKQPSWHGFLVFNT